MPKATIARLVDDELRTVEFDLDDPMEARIAQKLVDFFSDEPEPIRCPYCGEAVEEDQLWIEKNGAYFHEDCFKEENDDE